MHTYRAFVGLLFCSLVVNVALVESYDACIYAPIISHDNFNVCWSDNYRSSLLRLHAADPAKFSECTTIIQKNLKKSIRPAVSLEQFLCQFIMAISLFHASFVIKAGLQEIASDSCVPELSLHCFQPSKSAVDELTDIFSSADYFWMTMALRFFGLSYGIYEYRNYLHNKDIIGKIKRVRRFERTVLNR